MHGTPLTECLACGAGGLRQVLDLGEQTLANEYLDAPAPRARFPLELNLCEACLHAQLGLSVDPALLFGEYAYASGTSGTLRRYFEWFAQATLADLAPASVLEIACNDGSLLECYAGRVPRLLGVDPAANICALARARGLEVRCAYWPGAAASIEGDFDLVIAQNVLAHVPDPAAFLRGCMVKLAPGGTLLLQTSQAAMIPSGEFDTIYHEHLSFFSDRSMLALCARVGLALVEVRLADIHGGSAIWVCARAGEGPREGRCPGLAQGAFALPATGDTFPGSAAAFDAFARKARELIAGTRSLLEAHRARGYRIVAVGAAAKAMTFLEACGVQVDLLLDEAPLKLGRHAPYRDLPVQPLAALETLGPRVLFVVTAWNFYDELKRKIEAHYRHDDGLFCRYFPALGIEGRAAD